MFATQTKTTQDSMTPAKALSLLKAGNDRFLAGERGERDLNQQVDDTKAGQYPFAVILGCIDSRVPPEVVFDLGVGDVFCARVAGNFVNKDLLGSMEFACKVAGAKLVIVLGHTSCGAVKGACDGVELGNLTAMLSKVLPSVEAIAEANDAVPRTSENPEFVEAVAEHNVRRAVGDIRRGSDILRALEADGAIEIVGAKYDVSSGVVAFLED